MENNLLDKVAVVTGSGKGIGRGIAYELVKQGAKIVINYNFNSQTAQETVDYIKNIGGDCVLVKADVSNSAEAKMLMETAVNHYGKLDILVNNAALQLNYDLDQYDSNSFDTIFKTNFGGYYNCINAAIPYLKNSPAGRIINISSVHGKRPGDFDVIYSTSKGAIKMLTREAAIELAKYKITVNQLLPAGVRIEFKSQNESLKSDHFKYVHGLRKRKFKHNGFPLGRAGLPSDCGHMVCYLSSEKAEHISGTSIRLDGTNMLL